MHRILLVEDDLGLIEGLAFSLKKNGFSVDIARSVQEGAAAFQARPFDLLLLDVTLPDGSGFELCRSVRQSSRVPIIFLTAADEEVSIVMGLDMGGDDYITKPFKLNELVSRINALLRRAGQAEANGAVLSSNGITVYLPERRVKKGGVEIDLTAAEYRLLCLLMQNPNQTLPREVILDRLWDGSGSFVDDNTLSVYVRRLRSKTEQNPETPRYLQTVRGVGYKWNVLQGGREE